MNPVTLCVTTNTPSNAIPSRSNKQSSPHFPKRPQVISRVITEQTYIN